jgi:hypothetical protein
MFYNFFSWLLAYPTRQAVQPMGSTALIGYFERFEKSDQAK